MKKTILLLVLAAIHVTVLAQHSLQLYDELSNEESHQFIATDHILLSSGFKSEHAPCGAMEHVQELVSPRAILLTNSRIEGNCSVAAR